MFIFEIVIIIFHDKFTKIISSRLLFYNSTRLYELIKIFNLENIKRREYNFQRSRKKYIM